MARGKRPVSFRTRKLSLSAPMVLPRGRGGRVGRRRTTIPNGGQSHVLWPPFACVSGPCRRRVPTAPPNDEVPADNDFTRTRSRRTAGTRTAHARRGAPGREPAARAGAIGRRPGSGSSGRRDAGSSGRRPTLARRRDDVNRVPGRAAKRTFGFRPPRGPRSVASQRRRRPWWSIAPRRGLRSTRRRSALGRPRPTNGGSGDRSGRGDRQQRMAGPPSLRDVANRRPDGPSAAATARGDRRTAVDRGRPRPVRGPAVA